MDNEMIRRLNFENLIWVTFIIISVVDIYGDELIKKGIHEKDKDLEARAQNLFLVVSLISILVYIYFFYRNYSDFKNNPSKRNEVRLLGSILILAGAFCLFYFQLYNKELELPPNI